MNKQNENCEFYWNNLELPQLFWEKIATDFFIGPYLKGLQCIGRARVVTRAADVRMFMRCRDAQCIVRDESGSREIDLLLITKKGYVIANVGRVALYFKQI